MKIEYLPTDALIEYSQNNVRHSATQVDRIANSIREYGWTVPLLVSKDGVIVAGHGRLAAARKLGLDSVPVLRAEDMTPAQERQYRVLDNALARQSEWDLHNLGLEFDLMKDDGFDFEEWGLDQMFPAIADKFLDLPTAPDAPDAPAAKDNPQFLVVVECDGEARQQELYDEFQQRGLKCRLIT